MSQAAVNWNLTSSDHGMLRNTALLTAAQLGVLCLILPIALWQQGNLGFLQCMAAWLLGWVPSLAALAISHRFLGTPQALLAILGGMALRAVPPLVVCLFLAMKGSGQQWFHFICYLLVFYMVALAVETYLSVALLKTRQPSGQGK